MQTNFARAVFRAIDEKNVTQAALAKRSGLTQPTIARIIGQNRRPDVSTLRALCNCWDDTACELGLLCEHLRDEICRAGKLEGDIVLHPKEQPRNGHQALDADLDLIRSEAVEHEDMKGLLADMANIIRRHRSRRQLRLAAEDRPPYPRKDSEK